MERIKMGEDLTLEVEKPKKSEDKESNPEKVDRLLAVREKNARIMIEIERMMSEGDVQDEETFKNLCDRVEQKYEELDIKYNEEKRRENFFKAARDYLLQRRRALEQENKLRQEMMAEGEMAVNDGFSMGHYLFKWQTGEKSKRRVFAEQQEGYFLIYFEDRIDFLHFSNGAVNESDIKKSQNIGGEYHRAISLSKVQDIKAVLVNKSDSSDSQSNVSHERQHFLNDVAFGDFEFTESSPSDKRLRAIKNELLSYLRDGSDPERITGFLNNTELYGHLTSGFTKLEQRGIEELMKQIGEKLKDVIYFFHSHDDKLRAQLVYQLVDTPLEKIPTMLDRLGKYYGTRHRKYLDDLYESLIKK